MHDLSQPETLAITIAADYSGGHAVRFTEDDAAPGVDPAQQKMMMFMPLMFGYIFYFLRPGWYYTT